MGDAPDVLRLEEAESPTDRTSSSPRYAPGPRAGRQLADSIWSAGNYQVQTQSRSPRGSKPRRDCSRKGQRGSRACGSEPGARGAAHGGGYDEEIVLDAAAVVPIPMRCFVTAAAFRFPTDSHCADPYEAILQPGETLDFTRARPAAAGSG